MAYVHNVYVSLQWYFLKGRIVVVGKMFCFFRYCRLFLEKGSSVLYSHLSVEVSR